MMTAKHFIALADAIKSAMSDENSEALFTKYEKEVLADFCASQNPNFKRQRWLDYIDGKCGPRGGAVK